MSQRTGVAVIASVSIATMLLAVACSRHRRPVYEGPFAESVNAAIPKIEEGAGVPFKRLPKVETRSKDQVRAFLEKKFEEDQPAREIAGMESAYKRFGLLPDTLHLRQYMLDLLNEQVVGYYDPSTKVLYVVDGSPADIAGVTVSHELVHALQDQYIPLDSIQHIERDNDRQSAVQAVIEGEATFEQLGAQTIAKIPGGWERVRDLIRESSTSMPRFSAAPEFIQETLIFPYLSGADFVRRYKERAKGPPFLHPPQSTEQVLHSEAYFGTPDTPTRVHLSLPAGMTALYENDLGEFETRLFLFHHGHDENMAISAASGWDGDRYVLVDVGGGEGLAWASVWDSPVDAAEFVDALDRAMQRRTGTKATVEGTTRRWAWGARILRVEIGDVSGRPVVVFTDLPSTASARMFTVGSVTLEP